MAKSVEFILYCVVHKTVLTLLFTTLSVVIRISTSYKHIPTKIITLTLNSFVKEPFQLRIRSSTSLLVRRATSTINTSSTCLLVLLCIVL